MSGILLLGYLENAIINSSKSFWNPFELSDEAKLLPSTLLRKLLDISSPDDRRKEEIENLSLYIEDKQRCLKCSKRMKWRNRKASLQYDKTIEYITLQRVRSERLDN